MAILKGKDLYICSHVVVYGLTYMALNTLLWPYNIGVSLFYALDKGYVSSGEKFKKFLFALFSPITYAIEGAEEGYYEARKKWSLMQVKAYTLEEQELVIRNGGTYPYTIPDMNRYVRYFIYALKGFVKFTFCWPYYLAASIPPCFDERIKLRDSLPIVLKTIVCPLYGIWKGIKVARAQQQVIDAGNLAEAELRQTYVREAREIRDLAKPKMKYTKDTLSGGDIERMYRDYQKSQHAKKDDVITYDTFRKEAIKGNVVYSEKEPDSNSNGVCAESKL